MKKTCEVCKKAFETNKSFMKYCSIECQKIIYKVKRPMYYKKIRAKINDDLMKNGRKDNYIHADSCDGFCGIRNDGHISHVTCISKAEAKRISVGRSQDKKGLVKREIFCASCGKKVTSRYRKQKFCSRSCKGKERNIQNRENGNHAIRAAACKVRYNNDEKYRQHQISLQRGYSKAEGKKSITDFYDLDTHIQLMRQSGIRSRVEWVEIWKKGWMPDGIYRNPDNAFREVPYKRKGRKSHENIPYVGKHAKNHGVVPSPDSYKPDRRSYNQVQQMRYRKSK